MYYVNREQIERRLQVLPDIIEILKSASDQTDHLLLHRYAEERALHLAIEVVTDVGSYLIDGFIMRDASSYEDIVDIMLDEHVVPEDMGNLLIQLVRLRRPLVQEYFSWDKGGLESLMHVLPDALADFAHRIRVYLDQELSQS
ncbi:uncharacterized protein YutE (UPF0331/DUF86 family) [Paenibacillus shirakamiensis]|uniref:Uncharacterized protein YutE (UPF0331/DUF86 family) n=1 Tax=Paenibacillus shirakamiensis TaxID=1265935 RepID=A0ABS4JHY6_9BACL|nr:HepT-like ribonuclease domain-containing protein [Paenibacillus shirakamiensis]MBP2001338.1 uncharacterized protein YutE (UPF0331/DUF86 family) [Paenibacillus shirakamiensis]